MVKLMYEKDGLGLSGNQVGLPYSFFAMRGYPEDFFLINPKIVNATGELIDSLEGCLSYPGLAIKQQRWMEVRVRFSTPDGDTHTKTWQDISARVVQHEINHLEGQPWWHISKIKFDMAKRKAHTRGWDYSGLTYKGV